jgi:hypothetical protein
VELLDDREFGLGEAVGSEEDGRVRIPLEPGFVDEGGPADCDFADGIWEGGACADGAEEGVPACWRGKGKWLVGCSSDQFAGEGICAAVT